MRATVSVGRSAGNWASRAEYAYSETNEGFGNRCLGGWGGEVHEWRRRLDTRGVF